MSFTFSEDSNWTQCPEFGMTWNWVFGCNEQTCSRMPFRFGFRVVSSAPKIQVKAQGSSFKLSANTEVRAIPLDLKRAFDMLFIWIVSAKSSIASGLNIIKF